ncbi:MAG TPA: hypothetical protein VF746_17735 [Longimicrobium sp.]|jgi:hypothetical protein
MLREMIGAERERRAVPLVLLTLLYLAIPGVYLVGLGGGAGKVMAGGALTAGLLSLAAMPAAAGWGVGAWHPERRGGWAYALSLPVSRRRYFAMRYLAGLAWLAVPVGAAGLLAGGIALSGALPAGLYAYPLPFLTWAALASWFLYSAGFVASARFERPWLALALAAAACWVWMMVAGGLSAAGFLDASPLGSANPLSWLLHIPMPVDY